MDPVHWDKKITKQLLELGLNLEQAGAVIGIIAEERMANDHEGYVRGYNNGFAAGQLDVVNKHITG